MNALWPVLTCLALGAASPETRADVPQKYLEGLPFPMGDIHEPAFPPRTVSITAYGAAGDGVTMNTDAIQSAIRECAGAGGGTVDVPPGIWLSGPVRLMSNIRLHVRKGAVILFSRRFEDYPLIAGPDGTSKSFRCVPCLYGYRLENIAITGGGMFDGQGEFWRPVKKEKMTPSQWQRLLASGGAVSADGGTWFPSREAMEGEEYLKTLSRKERVTADDYVRAREFLRPVMVQLVDCRNVLIKNVVCAGAETAVRILGLESKPLQGITLDSIVITSATGLVCTDADGIALRNVSIRPARGPVMSFTRSRGVTISGAHVPGGVEPFLRVEESGPGAISVEGTEPCTVELGAGVPAGAVVRR